MEYNAKIKSTAKLEQKAKLGKMTQLAQLAQLECTVKLEEKNHLEYNTKQKENPSWIGSKKNMSLNMISAEKESEKERT